MNSIFDPPPLYGMPVATAVTFVHDPNPLTRIGVFHRGINPNENKYQLDSLKEYLEGKSPDVIADALVVLPECFNKPSGFYGGEEIVPPHEVREGLKQLSRIHKAAFVVGFVEGLPERALAYLIDCSAGHDKNALLTWKRYPSGGNHPIEHNHAVEAHRGLAITAQICNDFTDCSDHTFRENLLRDLGKRQGCHPVICVPAWSTHGRMAQLASPWVIDGVYIAAASGTSSDDSFIMLKGQPDILIGQPRDRDAILMTTILP